MRKVKGWEEVCLREGVDPARMPDVSWMLPELRRPLVLHYMLMLVTKAINPEGWVADYTNYSQEKHTPWVYLNEDKSKVSGRGLSLRAVGYAYSTTAVGPRLTFASEKAAKYAILHPEFIDLWKEAKLGIEEPGVLVLP